MTSTPINTQIPPTDNTVNAGPKLHPRRTLNRLAMAIFAAMLGLVGQSVLQPNSEWDGLLLILPATVLFVWAVGHHVYPNFQFSLGNSPYSNTLIIYGGWRRNGGIWAVLMAVGISGFGYTFFGREESPQQAWWIYAASLLFFIGGLILMTPAPSFRAELRHLFPNRHIITGLGLILLAALFMRLYHFTGQPFGIWFDEAEAGLQARQMLQNSSYRPVFFPPINVTGHFLMLYTLALAWLGDTIYVLRLVSVAFGLAGVVAAYLFGRELTGPRFGLLLAFLVAVARWHVNFSRIAMTGVDTTFFEFLTLFFLVRLLRRGNLRDAMWAGLTIGFGLTFYTAFRLFVLALLIFGLLAILFWLPKIINALGQTVWRRYASAMVILLLGGWLVVMPLVQYAINQPESFWYRTRQISILTKRDQADLSLALWQSTHKHLLMFNVAGDNNGRHNLPGEPMLDPLLGLFFIFGFGLALARVRHPANLFFLILFPITLLGGILSVDFEAPQSLRSIAVIPAVLYFAALALAALGQEAEESLRPLPQRWVLGPAIAMAGVMFLLNAQTYFVRQANDFASWNAFSAPETITGRKMAELGPEYVYILSPFLTNHPSTRFLAPDIGNQQHLALPDALPIRDPSGRPVALFLHPDDGWVFEQAKRLYPNAQFEVLTGPPQPDEAEGPPSVFVMTAQPADINAIRGLELRYLPLTTEESSFLMPPLETARVFNVNVLWPDDSPTGNPNDFMAEWRGTLYVPRYGVYTLRLVKPGPGLLEIDGNIISEADGEQQLNVPLAQGNHSLRIRAEGGTGQAALYWQPPGEPETLLPAWALYSLPVTNHGLLGSYYPNANWEEPLAFQRVDPFLDTYFHLVPMQRPYSVEWAGSLVAPQSGVYRLGLRAVQDAQLFLDGQLLLTTVGPNEYTEAPLTLEAGLHTLRILYRDTVDRSRMHLTWITPGGNFEAIPSDYLWPPLGNLPEAPAVPQAAITIAPISLRHVASFGLPGRESGQLLEPRDVAVMSNGNIVVADTGNRRVQIFSPQFNPLLELTGADLPFEEPLAVEVYQKESGTEEILVLDSTLQWIYRYTADGALIDRFGGPEARFFHPRGMTLLDNNQLAIADTGTARAVFFDITGSQSGALGSGPGSGPGQLNEPTDIIKDAFNTYFIVEAENNRIQRLDAGGNPLNQWPIPPANAFNGPHLAQMPDGSLLMTDAQGQSLLRYTPEGVLIDQWHSLGPVSLTMPVGIHFAADTNLLYVTDVGTYQIHIFAVEVVTE